MSDLPGCPCSHCDEDYMNRSVSSVSVGHSADLHTNPAPVEDSLRTRIAKTLYRLYASHLGYADAAWDQIDREPFLFDAGVLIRELGLEREDGECGYCHAQLPGCRYVTEWTADE